jgi:ribose transport system ATP-binding protein
MEECKMLLRMENIHKDFSGVPVLEDVQFDLMSGEVHVLAGENGAGKSTLIKILGGIHRDYAGSIYLGDDPVRFHSPRDAFHRGISIIHQELSLIPGMSIVDNMFLGNEITRMKLFLDYRAQRERGESVLRRMGLNLNLSRTIDTFPLAVQQIVEISKALSFDARIVVMDEPTSALSEAEVEKLFSIVANLKARGCGIIYISHKMDEIYRIADRITVLRDGRHIGTERAEKLDRNSMIQWMVGRELPPFQNRQSKSGGERLTVKNIILPDPRGSPRCAVNDVSFSVGEGEVVGFAGLQGSGNSELFNALFGTYGAAARGTVRIDGEILTGFSPRCSIQKGLILLTNDRKKDGYIPGMSIVHNCTLASLPEFSPSFWLRKGLEVTATRKQVDALGVRAASLQMDADLLSGGNLQKVILGKWLQTKPRVLMLDDPTRGVDIGAKHEIYMLINRLTGEGHSILLISSEMPELLYLSDRILVMYLGSISAEFKRADATQEKILKAAMGVTGDDHES